MEISACPVCGTMGIRLETTDVVSHKVLSWRSGENRSVFVVGKDEVESTSTKRVVCVNGHAHSDRVGFDLKWE